MNKDSEIVSCIANPAKTVDDFIAVLGRRNIDNDISIPDERYFGYHSRKGVASYYGKTKIVIFVTVCERDDILKYLIEKTRVNLTAHDSTGRSAFGESCFSADHSCFSVLMRSPRLPDILNDGQSLPENKVASPPLHIAINTGNMFQCVNLLASECLGGILPKLRVEYSHHAIRIAAYTKNVEIVKLIYAAYQGRAQVFAENDPQKLVILNDIEKSKNDLSDQNAKLETRLAEATHSGDITLINHIKGQIEKNNSQRNRVEEIEMILRTENPEFYLSQILGELGVPLLMKDGTEVVPQHLPTIIDNDSSSDDETVSSVTMRELIELITGMKEEICGRLDRFDARIQRIEEALGIRDGTKKTERAERRAPPRETVMATPEAGCCLCGQHAALREHIDGNKYCNVCFQKVINSQ